MDRHALAILIPVITMAFTGLIAFSFTPLGRAIAKRIAGQAASAEADERLGRLEGELDALRHELNEAHERIDFSERALAQLRDGRPSLPRVEPRQVTPT